MELTQNVAAWLGWLSRVRFFLITLLLALVIVLGKTSQLEVSTRYFIPLMILWYTLAIVYTILMRWMPMALSANGRSCSARTPISRSRAGIPMSARRRSTAAMA